MFLPLRDENPLRRIRAPWVNWSLIGITVTVFLVQSLVSPAAHDVLLLRYGMIPLSIRDAWLLPEVLPVPELALLTYAFLHVDWLHLASNLLFLWVFGDNVEDALGHVRYLLFYLACAVLASLAHFVAYLDDYAPLVGASGAVAGVMGAYALLYPRAQVLVLARIVIPLPLLLPAVWMLGAWFLVQLLYALSAEDQTVAWWAHVGGMVAGAGLGWCLARRGAGRHLQDTLPPADPMR